MSELESDLIEFRILIENAFEAEFLGTHFKDELEALVNKKEAEMIQKYRRVDE